MSRCQHGQKITLFCIHQGCTWRQAGGCEKCFKKYHDHQIPQYTLTDQQLNTIFKKTVLKHDVKYKSRSLQEAVYNYFMILKSQISSSIDAVSRGVINRISHPYLFHQGHLATYKKIKSKQYKKISKKELINFYHFTGKLKLEQFQRQQRNMYIQETKEMIKSVNQINQSFISYGKAVSKYDQTFNIQKSFFSKIRQIIGQINQQFKINGNQNIQNLQSRIFSRELKSPDMPIVQNRTQNNLEHRNHGNFMTNRKVSIQSSFAQQMQRLNKQFNSPINYDQNQKKIQAQKRKLLELLDSSKSKKQISKEQIKIQPPQQKVITQNISKVKQVKGRLAPLNIDLIKKRKISNHKQIPQVIKEIQQLQIQQKKKPQIKKEINEIPQLNLVKEQILDIKEEKLDLINKSQDSNKIQNQFKLEDENGINLLADLMNKGINIPQMILHTILPRVQSKKKLYEHTQQVKQKKIVVPVRNYKGQDQISSPLLKKRKKNNQGRQIFQVKKVLDQNQQNTESHSPKAILKQQKQQQHLQLKDKQTSSIALLIQSLPLPVQKAIPLLQTAIKYANNNVSAAEYLSYLYLQTSNPKKCLDLCNQILQQMQDSPQYNQISIHIHNNKAAALNLLGRYSQSISILQKCLSYNEKDIFYKNLGDAYYCLGIYEKAVYNYECAIKLNNNLDEGQYNLAVCLFQQQNYYHAQISINKALKLVPDNQNYIALKNQIKNKIRSI